MPYSKLYYQIIWSTKNRLPLIEATFEPKLYRVIAEKVKAMDGFVYAVGGTIDHIHLAIFYHPSYHRRN